MAFTIQVRMKKLGKQKSQDLQPVPFELAQKPETVRELLTSLTALGVKDYNTRKDEGQVLRFLTREEIADQAARGKISRACGAAKMPWKKRPSRTPCSALRTASSASLPGRMN